MSNSRVNRRQLLKAGILTASALPLLNQPAEAAEKLSIADPLAAKLGYVENGKQVDIKRFPTYQAKQTCANCKFIQLRYGFLRPCELFPGKVVSEKGWCSAWVEKVFK